MDFNNEELVSVLRALHWHVDRLANTDENVRDEAELWASKDIRNKFVNELKRRTFTN